MRLVTYVSSRSARAGIELGDRVLDTEAVARHAGLASDGDYRWRSNRLILGAGPDALVQLAEAVPEVLEQAPAATVGPSSEVELRPPILDPEKIVCLGLNYRDHADEAGLPAPVAPMLFGKYGNSLVGPTAPIRLPVGVETVDYEAELAVVIGSPAKNVSAEEAGAVIAGAMALNDVSARELQLQTSQWMAGKAIDSFAPCGPALVTVEELGDLQSLDIGTRINGATVQAGRTTDMIFSIAETVAFLSRLMTLKPGDVIATGTPAGVGHTRQPPLLVKAGDTMEVEVEGIGILRNSVVPPAGDETQSTATAASTN